MEKVDLEKLKQSTDSNEFKMTELVVKKFIEIIRNLGGHAIISVNMPNIDMRMVLHDSFISKQACVELLLGSVADLSVETTQEASKVRLALQPAPD